MVRQLRFVLAAAAIASLGAVGAAQTPQAQTLSQQQAAPIQRAYQGGPAMLAPGQSLSPGANDETAIPVPGVLVRVGPHSTVREISSNPQKLELSVDRGVANVNVHKPAKDLLILVDLPNGQTQLLKNGLYTFDAQTDTARVLKGEALAFPATQTADNDKPLKIKEDHKVVFNGTDVKSEDFPPYEARMDLLAPPANADQGGAGFYGYGPYYDGFYAAPYWAYGYAPWGWASPYPYYAYPYGYPFGFGVGIGYVGGWGHGGGFHGGGFHGGFHGGGFHGGGHGRR